LWPRGSPDYHRSLLSPRPKPPAPTYSTSHPVPAKHTRRFPLRVLLAQPIVHPRQGSENQTPPNEQPLRSLVFWIRRLSSTFRAITFEVSLFPTPEPLRLAGKGIWVRG